MITYTRYRCSEMCCFTRSTIVVQLPWSKLGLSAFPIWTTDRFSPFWLGYSNQKPFGCWPYALTARLPASTWEEKRGEERKKKGEIRREPRCSLKQLIWLNILAFQTAMLHRGCHCVLECGLIRGRSGCHGKGMLAMRSLSGQLLCGLFVVVVVVVVSLKHVELIIEGVP